MYANIWLFPTLNQVKAFYSYREEPATIKNLKRGLASLLQVQLNTGKVIEVSPQQFCFNGFILIYFKRHLK